MGFRIYCALVIFFRSNALSLVVKGWFCLSTWQPCVFIVGSQAGFSPRPAAASAGLAAPSAHTCLIGGTNAVWRAAPQIWFAQHCLGSRRTSEEGHVAVLFLL